MKTVYFVRHGESEWNAKGIWTGWTDIGLSEKGKEEARKAGETIRDMKFDAAYTSALARSKQTLEEIKKALGVKIPTTENQAFNERDYGDYTGKNKWEIQKEVGEQKFQDLRRGWNVPIKNGESLKDVYSRVLPYYISKIKPKLLMGQNILISAHGNSLRALVKYLDNISDANIANLEIPTGEVYVYKINAEGKIESKEIRNS